MKTPILSFYFLLLVTPLILRAQSPSSNSCSSAVGICSSTSYTFPAGVNAGTAVNGPDYGCLKTQPNPAWFFLQMQNNGNITFTMTSNPARDIDYIIWGPFSDPITPCASGLTSSAIISCSYSTASTETATIPSGLADQYYILMITNYSNKTTNISFSQTSGSGRTNCDILCNVTNLTADVSGCQSGAELGTYTITGTVTTFTPPDSGSITITSSCGANVSYNAPFGTSLNYTLPNMAGHGDSCTITAVYSKVSTCNRSLDIITPQCCTVSANSTVSACESQSITLSANGTLGGTYHWSGPNEFTSTLQSPVVPNLLSSQAGIYEVYLEYGACTTTPATVTVTVKPKPTEKQIVHQ